MIGDLGINLFSGYSPKGQGNYHGREIFKAQEKKYLNTVLVWAGPEFQTENCFIEVSQ